MLLLAALLGCDGVEHPPPNPGDPPESMTGSSPSPLTTCPDPEAREKCNEVDDDCDGLVDDADPDVYLVAGPFWFTDLDGDGFGAGEPIAACVAPPQAAESGMDCDDTDPEQHPGAEWFVDADGDTFGDPATRLQRCLRPEGEYVAVGGDCDDDDPRAAPGVDWHADQDGDGWGDPAVVLPSCGVLDPRVDDDTDCDDSSADRHPGADELCDGHDDDCDGVIDDGVTPTWYADVDGDGWGDSTVFVEACAAPMGFVAAGGDCDDLDDEIHPGAVDACDGIDNDCDGASDRRFTFGEALEVGASVVSIYGDVGDLDADGDPDVVASYWADESVLWFENLGGGAFGEPVVAELTDSSDIRLVDVDQDGALDVVACSYHNVGWYRNDGFGGFGEFTVVHEDVNGHPHSPVAADLDLDGFPDLLLAWWSDYEATWFENVGGAFGAEVVISELPNHPEDVRAADFDLDGDLDALVGSKETDTISWNENLGLGAFAPDEIITDMAWEIRHLETADVDGDGDPDVLAVTEGTTVEDVAAWYENLGGGLFDSNPRTITNGLWETPTLHVADLDGDSDPDVIVGEDNAEELAWYENLGAGAFGSGQVIVDLLEPHWAVAVDVDTDGLVDVVASFPFNSATIQWFPGQLEICP